MSKIIPESKNIIRILFVTAFILLIPLLAMQFSDEVDWRFFDFVIIGTLLMSTGLIYELGIKKLRNSNRRIIFVFLLIAAMLLAWAELAVGIFGTPFSGS